MSLPQLFHASSEPIRALVVGGRGGIGAAFVRTLQELPSKAGISVQDIVCTSRSKSFVEHTARSENNVKTTGYLLDPCSDFEFNQFSTSLKNEGFKPNLIFVATGVLHDARIAMRPETSFKKLSVASLIANYKANTVATALAMRYLLGDLVLPVDKESSQGKVFATLSAKVGSVSDNQAGG